MYINTTIPCKTDAYKGLPVNSVLEAGLEPARLLRPKDFKSFVSTDSTIRATLCFCCILSQRVQRYNKRVRFTQLALIFHGLCP